MKPNINNPYGYKVCCQNKRLRTFICYFKTRTYKKAVEMKRFFSRKPPKTQNNKKFTKRHTWVIIPIKRSEVRRGIWREAPFLPILSSLTNKTIKRR